jgi:hypothetical protein
MNARERRRRNSLGAGSDEPHASAVHRERPRNGQNSSPSQASAEGATRRARCVGARSCALSDESGASNESIGLLAILVTRGTVGSNFETRWNPRGDDAARPNEATAGGKAGGPSGSITRETFRFGRREVTRENKKLRGFGKRKKIWFSWFSSHERRLVCRSNVVGL